MSFTILELHNGGKKEYQKILKKGLFKLKGFLNISTKNKLRKKLNNSEYSNF